MFGDGGGSMTEDDWLASTDLPAILAAVRGRASEDQLRRFCIACCRRVWEVMPEVTPGVRGTPTWW
jgi:hypothetical protein